MKYNIELKINDVDYSKYLQEGLQIQETADETLDACSFVLDFTNLEDSFKPLTPLDIKITQNNTTKSYEMIVESDSVDTFYIGKTKKYTHNIIGVERTKLLEIPLPNISITPRLGFEGYSNSDGNSGQNSWDIKQNTTNKYFTKIIDDDGTTLYDEIRYEPPVYNSIYDVNMSIGGVYFVSMTTYFETANISSILPQIASSYYPNGRIPLNFEPLVYKTYWKQNSSHQYTLIGEFRNYPKYTITFPSGSTLDITKDMNWDGYTLSTVGDYTITVAPETTIGFVQCQYSFPEGNLSAGNIMPYLRSNVFNDSATFKFKVINQNTVSGAEKNKTLYDAVTKVLASVKPNIAKSATTINGVDVYASFSDVLPRFRIDSSLSTFLKSRGTPSFTFTNKTLLEALKSIGSVFNGIPRLKKNTIYYDIADKGVDNDKFDDSTEVEKSSINSTNYGTSLISNVTNMVPSLVKKTWPSNITQFEFQSGTFAPARTTRDQYNISKSNLSIDLGELYIYKIDKIEMCNFLTDDPTRILNITEFCIDKTVYDALPNTINGKGKHIYYERNTPYIQGLGQVVDKGTLGGLIPDMEYTINNIIIHYNLYINGKINNPKDFRYRVTGTFYINSTISTEKENISDTEYGQHIPLIYNQEENNIDSDKFLKNTQRIVSRLANPEINKSVSINSLDELPSLGEIKKKVGAKYLATVINTQYNNHNITSTLQYSKNFNKISNFVGIDKEWKENTIETKDIVDRCVHLNSYCYIDTAINPNSGTGSTNNYMNSIVKNFSNLLTGSENVIAPDGFLVFPIKRDGDSTFSRLKYKNSSGTETYCKPVLLPANIVHGWNSVSLIGSAYDNYSFSTKAGVLTGAGTNNLYDLEDVRYVDNFGECDCLFMQGININRYLEAYNSFSTFPEISVDLSTELMNNSSGVFMNSTFIDVQKDNREKLSFNYQLNAVSKIDYVHVHSGLLKYMYNSETFSTSSLLGKVSVVGMETDYEPMLENVLSTGMNIYEHIICDINTSKNGNTIILQQASKLNPSKNYKWYALVWHNTGEILLGIDRPTIAYNKYDILENSSRIYFNFIDHRQESQ